MPSISHNFTNLPLEKMKEIDNSRDFEEWNQNPQTPAAIQSLDLSLYEEKILSNSFEGSLFLGCKISNKTAGHIVSNGGVVIPNTDLVSFPIHKSHLYSPVELFEGFDLDNPKGYKETYDHKIFEEYYKAGMENPKSISVSIARRLHDHSITDALEELIENRKVVAIMGGHSMERQDPYYLRIAKISRTLTQKGFLMISGGGPGAMEATHLGAYFACREEEELKIAIDEMKTRPKAAPKGKEYNDNDWLHRAWKIMLKYPIPKGKLKESMSVGIPTWLYGHEPPALFATQIAKYFANSVREDTLLSIAKHGVVFAPGSAGTTQEIFQDATQNHYAPYNKNRFDFPAPKKHVSPMILFGIKRWTIERPLWEFLKFAAKGKKYAELLYLTESEEEVIGKILNYDPKEYTFPSD